MLTGESGIVTYYFSKNTLICHAERPYFVMLSASEEPRL
jgi:hypothetical protein